MSGKRTVMLVCGGRSTEHEVSLLSARNVCQALDEKKFNLVIVGISLEGSWYLLPDKSIFNSVRVLSDKSLPPEAKQVVLYSQGLKPMLLELASKKTCEIDVAFPVLHGPFGEDGTIQGLFRMCNLPYVGCGVLASAACMDKSVTKRLLRDADVPTAKSYILSAHRKYTFDDLEENLGVPFFLKPAGQGSSVGVHKIKSAQDFERGLKDALQYDNKVLVEEFIQGREIECSVLGTNDNPRASLPAEIIPNKEFYNYEAKYVDEDGAALKVPAILTDAEIVHIQGLAKRAYSATECSGMARVDFFMKPNGQVLVNEINTIPGFTKISMYPKMWEATGLPYTELISQLIELAVDEAHRDGKLLRKYAKI